MIKYVLIIAGLLVMCVPDDASITRFIIQGLIGLDLFASGVYLAIREAA